MLLSFGLLFSSDPGLPRLETTAQWRKTGHLFQENEVEQHGVGKKKDLEL